MRTSGLAMLILMLVVNSFAAPTSVHASTAPHPSILLLLGAGLVGLATLIRRRLSNQ